MPTARTPSDFGLDNGAILAEASELSSNLFTALLLVQSVVEGPIEDRESLRRAFLEGADDDAESSVARIIASIPDEFFPIDTKRDLLRKTYIALAIADSRDAEVTMQRLRGGALKASHPLPEVG